MPKTNRAAARAAELSDVGSENFNRVMAGLAEVGPILEGSAPPASYKLHQVHVPDAVDVKAIRTKTGLSQAMFAATYGFSLGAVRDWEQERKPPEKTARILLTILDRRPELMQEVLSA